MMVALLTVEQFILWVHVGLCLFTSLINKLKTTNEYEVILLVCFPISMTKNKSTLRNFITSLECQNLDG